MSKEKRRLLFITAPLILTAALILGFVLDHALGGGRAGDLIATLVLNITAFVWIRYDSDDRGYKLHWFFPYAVVIFGTLALIYYLFRSRGFAGGLRSVGWMVIYAFVLLIVATVVALLVGMVLVLIGIVPADSFPGN